MKEKQIIFGFLSDRVSKTKERTEMATWVKDIQAE